MAQNREHIHMPQHVGEKAADSVAFFVGSWLFVIIMTVLLVGWVLWNTIPALPHFDPPQFILLNLCLSFIAGYTGPFVMMSQNRQAEKDRKRDDLEASEVQGIYDNYELLMKINQQQMVVINQHTEILQLLRDEKASRRPVRRREASRHEQ